MNLITREDFARKLCHALGLDPTERRMVAFVAWEAAEGNPEHPQAKFNALNTTQRMEGSWDFNSAGVQNYPDLQTGLDATVKTLQGKGHGYAAIRKRLKENRPPKSILSAVEASDWGTGGLAASIVDDVKASWDLYASKPIGQYAID